jgi:hypothetical protein
MKEEEKTLLWLLEQYHHYKFMNAGFFKGLLGGWYCGMNLGDFMQWLKSRED